MHDMPSSRSKFSRLVIHSTDIREGKIFSSNLYCSRPYRVLEGPAVLIPRVGKPIPEKIVVLEDNASVILSDCVIGIKCKSIRSATVLRNKILKNWSYFFESYKGTCAKFITIKRLELFLNNCSVRISKISARL